MENFIFCAVNIKPFSIKVDRSQSVEESDSDSEIVIAYPKVQHSEKILSFE